MIVIIGSSHDDILYFESAIQKKSAPINLLGRFPMRTGELLSQQIMIISGVYTSISAALVLSYVLEHYSPFFVINVGRCKGLGSRATVNSIAVSGTVIPADVDQREYENVRMGQIPGFEPVFLTDGDILMQLSSIFERFFVSNYTIGTFLSSETIFSRKEQFDKIVSNKTALGYDGEIVTDCESAGVFAACETHRIPCIAVKVIDSLIGDVPDLENYIKTLGVYSIVGKVITAFIGEMSRKDLVEVM